MPPKRDESAARLARRGACRGGPRPGRPCRTPARPLPGRDPLPVRRPASGPRRPHEARGVFLEGLRLTFQPGKAAGLRAVYHFTFTGKEEKEATVSIQDGTLQVQDGHQGEADLKVTADSETWLGFLAKERSLLWALLCRKIRIKGSPKLLVAFGKCFPS